MKNVIKGFGKKLCMAALCASLVMAAACSSGTAANTSSSDNTIVTSGSSADGGTDNTASGTAASTEDGLSDKPEGAGGSDTVQGSGEDQLRAVREGDTVADLQIAGMGKVSILLFPDQAPKAVENFVGLAEQGYYDGVTFHRVIEDFMIQGGDPTGTGRGGESFFGGSFEDEISSDLFPLSGSLCMANSGKNTNGSQFFIVTCKDVVNYSQLEQVAQSYKTNYGVDIDYSKMSKQCRNNYASVGGAYWLYCQHTVFGQVVEGMDIIEAADSVDTDSYDKPINDLVIEKITIRTV